MYAGSALDICEGCETSQWLREEQAKEQAKMVEKAREVLELTGSRSHLSFETFVQETGNELAYQSMLRFCMEPVLGPYLVGPYGCGKTHLAYAVAQKMLAQGFTVTVIHEPDLIQALHLGMKQVEASQEANQRAYGLLNSAKKSDLLIWDDAGRGSNKEAGQWYQNTVMEPWLEHRSLRGKPVIVTSNFGPDQFRRYIGGANWSRLAACCNVSAPIQVTGKDRRLEITTTMEVWANDN